MKLPLTLLLVAGVPLTTLALTPESASTTSTPRDEQEFQGKVGGWMVLDDGSVRVRLHLESGNDRWFQPPPSQSGTTQFELLALHTVLQLDGEDAVYVIAEGTTEKDGESVEKAMQLRAIGRR